MLDTALVLLGTVVRVVAAADQTQLLELERLVRATTAVQVLVTVMAVAVEAGPLRQVQRATLLMVVALVVLVGPVQLHLLREVL